MLVDVFGDYGSFESDCLGIVLFSGDWWRL